MKRYKIDLPNDYGSEADDKALQADFPGLEGDDLTQAAFDEIHELWPRLKMESATDFGGIFRSATPPPDTLPCWAWVSEDKYPDDPENTEWIKVQ